MKMLRIGLVAAIALPTTLITAATVDSAAALSADATTICAAGYSITPITVPNGMDPTTMTPGQLEAANLPPKPTDQSSRTYASDLQTWRDYITHPIRSWSCGEVSSTTAAMNAQGITSSGGTARRADNHLKTPGIISASSVGSGSYYNWGGWLTTGAAFNQAEANWTAPFTETDAAHQAAQESQWVGIGDGTAESDPLVQAGTWNQGNGASGAGQQLLWWEVYCSCAGGIGAQFLGYIGAADRIYTKVQASGTTDTMTVVDLTGGLGGTFTFKKMTSNYAGHVAEWIGERPTVNGSFTSLAKTGNTPSSASDTFTSAETKTAAMGSFAPISNFNRLQAHMVNCARTATLETAGGLNSAGNSFATTWIQYGVPQHC
jgi:hypothetical protein